MVAKAGLGLVGLSAINVGGVALAKPHLLGMDYMPEWHSLSEDNNFSTAYESGKFGNKYGKYLVGVTNKENKSWWEWAYRRLSNDKTNSTSKKFKKVEKVKEGFITSGNDTDKSLHKVCDEAYKTSEADGFGNEGDKFSKDEVWKYCSPGKLTTTSGDTGNDAYDAEKIGGGSEKTSLVSVKNSSNDWFWEIRNKDFWENTGIWSGSTGTGDNDSDKSSFKKEFGRKGDTESDHSKRQTVKQLCEKAYKAAKSDNKELTDAKKFCKLETDS